MSCFVDEREGVVVDAGGLVTNDCEGSIGFGGGEEWDCDERGALSGERRKEVRVSGVKARCLMEGKCRKSKYVSLEK
jgi:hypothetical protein